MKSLIKPMPPGIYALLLFPVYFAAWGRFGLKVPAACIASIGIGLLIKVFSTPRQEMSVNFPWALFLVFPLFAPLGMPLWLVAVALIAGWLISVSSFGGYGKNIFNPVIVALIFLICGYGSSVSLQASKPFPGPVKALATWTAGINPIESFNRNGLAAAVNFDLSLLGGGNFPSIPGLAFPGILMLAAIFMGCVFQGRRIWLITAISMIVFATFVAKRIFPVLIFGNLNIIFMGITPALILVAMADMKTIPVGNLPQFLHALSFALLLVCFVCFSDEVLTPVFALLLTQVVYPLLADVTGLENTA